MINCVIIDDQPIWHEALKDLLEEHFTDISIKGHAYNGKDGIKLIKKYSPQVVMLDVEMPGMTGFEMLTHFDSINFEIIFITAKDKYTLQAIKSSALDYILKPVSLKELKPAIEKVRKKIQPHLGQIEVLLKNIAAAKEPLKRIALPTLEGLIFVQVEDIVHCEADDNNTMFYFLNSKNMMVTKTLGDVVDLLKGKDFCRVHNSHFINLNHIKKYVRGNGGYVVMNNGNVVSVSRARKEEFLKMVSRV
ncbi:MAG TPA: response regulator [Bacteroidia bacterium]|nr:response regulator [Bacteroidia bacterium]HNU34581.1 response regulator [Bacteroidia bacterium]